jgi:hypothetical protein
MGQRLVEGTTTSFWTSTMCELFLSSSSLYTIFYLTTMALRNFSAFFFFVFCLWKCNDAGEKMKTPRTLLSKLEKTWGVIETGFFRSWLILSFFFAFFFLLVFERHSPKKE